MELETKGGICIVRSEAPVIVDAQSALDLIATAYHVHGASGVVIEKRAVAEPFFDLSTGIAGEILQKFSNYRMQIAIVGTFDGYTSRALRDFIYECNGGHTVFFVQTEEEAIQRLSKG